MDGPKTVMVAPVESKSFWPHHRLLIMIILVVIVAITMTIVSMVIYNQSGAAQLDLSRPGYKSVSSKVDREDEIDGFESTGSVTKDVIDDFTKLYNAQSEKAKSVDAFNGDPLNPELVF